MRNFSRPTVLLIMDGYGETSEIKGNAIAAAHKPNLDQIFKIFPHTTLGASGPDVGLPKGQMGNSEVGHLNIGAGRIVYQELTKITKEIEEGSFFANQVLIGAMDHSISQGSSLHLMGLLSDGGVHSHIEHLFALLDMAKSKGVPKVLVHCFLDGRDVPPRCAIDYINQLETYMKEIDLGKISTVSGRYYAMDRDNRWARVEKAYNAITLGEGERSVDAVSAVMNAYVREENDEFVLPTFVDGGTAVMDDDSIIMFNFRPDRARELTRTFVDDNFNGFTRKKIITGLHFVCLTQYDLLMPNVQVAFFPQSLNNTLGEYLSKLNLKQLRIAETEKYAHVTFFFNGGVELPNPGEDRILIPS
ncbi:MAG: 2,3-bisphosphoglycerate-independent phosphoglycerate mutase, partial [Acetobacterium sp.]|nr:2,3-bisphosphoglycerate-independent phosphoglycerate mutase [Acetobacterium sp.]